MNWNNRCISNLNAHLHMNLVKICSYVLYKLRRSVKWNLYYEIKCDFFSLRIQSSRESTVGLLLKQPPFIDSVSNHLPHNHECDILQLSVLKSVHVWWEEHTVLFCNFKSFNTCHVKHVNNKTIYYALEFCCRLVDTVHQLLFMLLYSIHKDQL